MRLKRTHFIFKVQESSFKVMQGGQKFITNSLLVKVKLSFHGKNIYYKVFIV